MRRLRQVFPASGGDPIDPRLLTALELELAELGFVLSSRLRARLETLRPEDASDYRDWLCGTLAASLGADQKHRPLFRRFPEDVPRDTFKLWMDRVLVHFLQGEDMPCVHCMGVGTTHVLSPCHHVVCDRCFDGRNYSGCPICNQRVDEPNPFIQPSRLRRLPKERRQFRVLELGEDFETAAKRLFLSFCSRAQAMSPTDREDLETLVRDFARELPQWIPDEIPVKENVAIVFGTLFRACAPDDVLDVARPHLRTATDVLRVIAAFSGADPALQGEHILKPVMVEEKSRWWGAVAKLLGQPERGPRLWQAQVPVRVYRFKVGKLPRRLRRALLAVLEGFDADLLVEDMLRHRSYWVWLGEFLHPHEYASRFPQVARAFAVVRRKSPDGVKAPRFQTFHARVEEALAAGDVAAAVSVLRRRPGELARRLDHALRTAADEAVQSAVLDAFASSHERLPTPMLLTLRSHFAQRTARAPVRVYWPKGGTAGGVSAEDTRSPLGERPVRTIVASAEAALLARFEALPDAPAWLVDRALDGVIVPFNERTASPGGIALPRGSTLETPIPPGKFVRFFLHWCEPERRGFTTDLDLSVGFYGGDWEYLGVCSYYELTCSLRGGVLAKSAGDLTSAPFPDGSSEFVDLDHGQATKAGVRYVVMVVNAYSGMAMSELERAFAGYMVREDSGGRHFDARTVEMKFDLQGANGIFVPVVFDLREQKLHWIDVYSKGMPALNNVESSNRAIQRICPDMIAYFASGTRASLYELALLHAAARGREVFLRGESTRRFERRTGESAAGFLERLRGGDGEEVEPESAAARPGLTALLFRGDLELGPETERYVLFPELVAGTFSASDLVG